MLEHTVKGLIESAVITHIRTGARAVLTVTMESADPWAAFNVRVEYDNAFMASGSDPWRYLWVKGERLAYSVRHVQETRFAGRPSFCIDAPRAAFSVRFVVEVPLPEPRAGKEVNHA